MKDYRLKENRSEYFTALYKMNLEHRIMPGLVYLYMPALAERFNWDGEQRLWFAFLNGMTQNPITSLRLFEQLPECPPGGSELTKFSTWFNDNWESLQYDTDRRYQKKDTVESIKRYAALVQNAGSQAALFTGRRFGDYWLMVLNQYISFGRLSTFSYLEYVKIMGFGEDCGSMFFHDKSGSKSHRNGMLFLLGRDHEVWDKRCERFGMVSHSGSYENFNGMCSWLERQADIYLLEEAPDHPDANRFTLESNLCTFKNHFFGRRYPGVYADMAWDRIVWHDERDMSRVTALFKEIRNDHLPKWLRCECYGVKRSIAEKAAMFAESGFPYRGELFLEVS